MNVQTGVMEDPEVGVHALPSVTEEGMSAQMMGLPDGPGARAGHRVRVYSSK